MRTSILAKVQAKSAVAAQLAVGILIGIAACLIFAMNATTAAAAASHEAAKGYPAGNCVLSTYSDGSWQYHAQVFAPFARAYDSDHRIAWWARMVSHDMYGNVIAITSWQLGGYGYVAADGQWHEAQVLSNGNLLDTTLPIDEPTGVNSRGVEIFVGFYDTNWNYQDGQDLYNSFGDYFRFTMNGNIITFGC